MKTQVIILVALLFAGVSNIKAEKEEISKETATTLTTSISGTITDAATGENLVGVKVVLEELNTVVYTDFDGNFEFKGVTQGNYTVSTDYVSYKTDDSVSVDTNKSKNLSIKLKADL
jgi:iron complex outermembrane receptor protein